MSTNNFDWWHSIQGFSEELDTHSIEKEDGSDYKTNSYSYRCDEFIKTHEKKHILFSGCSNTYGTGLTKEETWAHRVYKNFEKTYGCSGYFNLGLKGNNIYSSILNIFKYCKHFGNPDVIFINIPELKRFFDFDEKRSEYRITYYNKPGRMFYINNLIVYNTYLMLEQYCNSNNIKLFTFTYDCLSQPGFKCTNELFKTFNFKTFYYINQEKMIEDLFLLKQTTNDKYFDVARDRSHKGTGWNILWSDFIWNKYLENI